MLVYTQNVFAVAQTIVFLLFSLLFFSYLVSFPVCLFVCFFTGCYFSFHLTAVVVSLPLVKQVCLSEAYLSFDKCVY